MPSWAEFYQSDLQSVWALQVLPFAFLVYRAAQSPRYATAVKPDCARFVDRYTLIFAVLTLLDPLCTGPLLEWTGWKGSWAGQLIPFGFVYLGDFRVLALVFGIALFEQGVGRALRIAAGVSLLVPAVAGFGFALLSWRIEHVPIGVLWMIYEISFLALALWLARFWLPERHGELSPQTLALLRDVTAFAAVYYALWATADLMINAGGLDAGWAIRVVPNQLYYGLWIPFVYFRFFGVTGREGR